MRTQKEDIIKDYVTIVNNDKIGYYPICLTFFIKKDNPSPKEKKEDCLLDVFLFFVAVPSLVLLDVSQWSAARGTGCCRVSRRRRRLGASLELQPQK